MAYFTEESVAFLTGLNANNSKVWFDEHRKEYETHFRKPYLALADALVEQVAEVENEYEITPKQATYRINRDLRFSADKTPYKTDLGITISRYAKHDSGWPSYTCRVGLSGVWIAGGLYHPESDLRDHVRRYVADNTTELRVLMTAEPYASTFGELRGDAHKRPLAELKDMVEIEPLVLNKQWVFWQDSDDPELLTRPDLDQFILDQWEIARPVQEFLKSAVRSF